jgi:RNA polymerase sigma factor (TIGR02999 family)
VPVHSRSCFPFGFSSLLAAAGTGRYTPSTALSLTGFPAMNDVTRILSAIEAGDPQAAELLLPLVYDELRKLAAQKLAQEKPGQTLQATALVHEAYLRLVDVNEAQRWNSSGHFFAAAAEAMRRILVENARRRSRAKHGGGRERIELDPSAIVAPEIDEGLIALDGALDRLAKEDPLAADLVKLRYFVGLTIPQAAAMLGVSARKADFLWSFARAWLRREIEGE